MKANELFAVEVGMEIHYSHHKEIVTKVIDDEYFYDLYIDNVFNHSSRHRNNPEDWADSYTIQFSKNIKFNNLYNKLNGSN